MITLSSSLAAHQASAERRPFVLVSAANRRAGAHLLRWQRWYSGSEPDSPHACAVAGDGSLLRARNAAGTLQVSRVASPSSGSTYSSWTALQTGLVSGSGVALAGRPGEALVAYTRGTTVYVRTSADNGASWSAETAIVSEGSAIGAIAAAFRLSNGDACLFYTVGATLKRLRRTSGSWAGAGTAWTNSVASLSGVAVAHDGGDFVLLVTGTEATTLHKRCWVTLMGDGSLPANAWAGLVNVAESDAASTTTFAGPAVVSLAAEIHGAFAHREAGNVAYNRAFESHPPAAGPANGTWSEPQPHEAASAFGLALGYLQSAAANTVYATTPSGVWAATINQAADLSARLIRASVRFEAFATRCQFELDDSDGALLPATAESSGLTIGGEVAIWPGYLSGTGGTPEYGVTWVFTVDALVRRVTRDRRRVVVVEASGPWEQVGRWQAPQAWQTPAGSLNRGQIFARIAGRAGFPAYAGTGGRTPSAGWTTASPSFALTQGEDGATALRRLLAPVNDGIATDGSSMTVVGLNSGGSPGASYGPGGHPVSAIGLREAAPGANWVRAQSADRYADAFDLASLYQHGPRRRWLRILDATTDTKASDAATGALRRDGWGTPTGRLVAPFHAGQQLFDLIGVTSAEAGLTSATTFRVLALGLEYERGPAGARYDSVIELGAP